MNIVSRHRWLWRFLDWLWPWVFPHPLEAPDHGDPPLTEQESWELGYFPAIAFAGAVCLLIVALGFNAARVDALYHEAILWVGMLTFYAFVAWRLVSPAPSRRERVALVLYGGVGLYLIKVLHSPIYFTFYDELLHYRTAANIIQTGRQFVEHSLLPVSPLYPGLENVAVALVNLTGLDLYAAGILTILVARAVFVLVIFLFYEKTSQSARLAGIAALIYAANPHFIFFDAQYSYESLALVFVVMVLFGMQYRLHHQQERPTGASLLIVFGISATLVTHHVTSYFLLLCLVLWAAVATGFRYKNYSRWVLWGTAVLAFVAILSWMMYVAIITIDYLVPVLSGAVFDLFKVLLRDESGRQLFSDTGEHTLRPWERLIVLSTAITILLGLMGGALFIWWEQRNRPTYIFLGIIGLLYPVTQLLRFSEKGPEIASRIGPFMFIGIAFVIAVAATRIYHPNSPPWPVPLNTLLPHRFRAQGDKVLSYGPRFWWAKHLLLTGLMLIMFWGNFLVSFPRWALMPGTYLASADTRSIESIGIETAWWVGTYLGEGQRIAADRINGLMMVAYANQFQVTGSWLGINVPGVFLDTPFTAVEYATLCQGEIRYLVVDHRFTEYKPMLGFYYEAEERPTPYRAPLEAAVLDKFLTVPTLSLVYDNGTIRIYEVDLGYCDG
jgi:hypothetical protein